MGEIFEKVGCPEPIGMVFGFEKLLGQCDEGLGHGGIFSFIEPEEHIYPIGDPVEYGSAIERLGGFLEGFRIVDIDKGIVLEPVLDALSVDL